MSCETMALGHLADSEGPDYLHIQLVLSWIISYFRPLLQFFDKKYFLTLSREVCESRRKYVFKPLSANHNCNRLHFDFFLYFSEKI